MTVTLHPADAVNDVPTYTGRQLRQALVSPLVSLGSRTRPLGGRTGIRPGTPDSVFSVTGSTWSVGPHVGTLDLASAAEAGCYTYAVDAAITGTITAANATNPRADLVYAELIDNAESAASGPPRLEWKYIAGSAANPNPDVGFPAVPARSMAAIRINVPKAGGGNPTAIAIAPFSATAGGVVPFRSLAELKLWTNPGDDQRARIQGKRGEWEWNGARWIPMFPMAGVYSYRQNVGTGGTESTIVAVPVLDASSSSEFIGEIFDLSTAGWTAKFDMEIEVDANAYDAIGATRQGMNFRAFWRSRRSAALYQMHPIYNPFETDGFPVRVRMYLRAGEVLGFSAYQGSGNTHTMVLDPRITYLGPI